MSQCTVINAHITDQVLQLSNLPRIASGSVNALQIRCSFCGKWEGCGKVAVFYRDGGPVYHVAIVSGLVTVPWEVLTEEGHFWFGIMGEDDLTRTTEVIRVEVAKGAITVATATPEEPTPDIYQQLLLALGRVDALVAMRNDKGAVEYEFSDTSSTGIQVIGSGNIVSNGAAAYTSFTLRGMSTLLKEEGSYYETGYILPPEFAPLTKSYLVTEMEPANIKVAIDPAHANAEGWLKIEVTKISGQTPMTLEPVYGRYDLASVGIAELADLRAWGDTTYASAGDAVRDQVGKLTGLIHSVGNIAGVLASPTTDDDGKFLQVVDGKPAWVTITDGEGEAY